MRTFRAFERAVNINSKHPMVSDFNAIYGNIGESEQALEKVMVRDDLSLSELNASKQKSTQMPSVTH